MMNKRLTSLVLVLALSLSVGVVSALADEDTTPVTAAAPEGGITVTVENPAVGGTDTQSSTEIPVVLVPPDPAAKVVRFGQIEELIKKNSPTYDSIISNIAAVEEAEDQMEEVQKYLAEIEKGLQEVNAGLADLEGIGLSEMELAMKVELLASKSKLLDEQAALQSAIGAIGALTSQDPEQLRSGARQYIMGCEALYIQLVDLEIQKAALEREIAALDRMLAALKIRQEGGQVSELQIRQTESGRDNLISTLATLCMNMDSLRMNLEMMLGEELTGTLAVGQLPKVTEEQLDALDPEKDLKTVLRTSPEIQAADDRMLALKMANSGTKLDRYLIDAAVCNAESVEWQVEVKFRTLYAQLQDHRQALAAASAALDVAQKVYDAEALKFERGSISNNALLDAEDTLLSAKDAVAQAENKLFSTYNQYQWAAKYGLFT